MIPQRKPALPTPWANVEQRRQPAANDASYKDGESNTNWAMLLAALCGIAVAVIVFGGGAWNAGAVVWEYRTELLGSIVAFPAFWGLGAAAALALALSFVRARRERRLSEELTRQLSGGAR